VRDRHRDHFIVCLCVLCAYVVAGAQESASHQAGAGEWSAEMSLSSHDIWRGFDDAGANTQMAVTYARGPWEFCTTVIYEAGTEEENHNHAEVDLVIARHVKLRHNWSLVAGYQYFGTPLDDDEHAHEFWAGAEYTGRIDFSLKASQFATPHRGNYFSAEAGRTLYRRGRYSLRGETSLGFNRHMRVEGAGFSDMTFTVIPAIRTRRGSLEPFFTFSKTLNHQWFGNQMAFGMTFVMGKAE
jgi:hypothetical protein